MTDAPGIRIPCPTCGHSIAEDPKAPGQPGMHFCAPDEDLDFERLATAVYVPPPRIDLFRTPMTLGSGDVQILPPGHVLKISRRKPGGEIEYTILAPDDPEVPP